MSLTRKVAWNTLIQIVGKTLTTITSLFLIAALTRYLGVAGFGQYTTAFAYVAFLAVFADLGFFWILVKELAHGEEKPEKIINNIIALRSIVALVIFAIGWAVAFLIPNYSPIVRWGIGITAIAYLFMTLNMTYVGLFQAKLKMERSVIGDVIGRVIILTLVLILISHGASLLTILTAYIIGNGINFLISIILGWQYNKFGLGFNFDYWKKIIHQGWPIGVAIIFSYVYFKIDTVILSLIKGPTDVGIYGAPYKIIEIILLLPGMFMGSVFPIFTRYFKENDQRLAPAFQKSFDAMVIMGMVVTFSIFFLAKPIINLIAGGEFVQASTISLFGQPMTAVTALQILIFACGITFFCIFFNNLILAIGEQRKAILPSIICAIFNIALNFAIIPYISYIGAAITTILTQALITILLYRIVRKKLQLLPKMTIVWKTLLAVIVMSAFLYFFSSLNLFILLAAAGIIYFGILLIVKGITPDILRAMVKGK